MTMEKRTYPCKVEGCNFIAPNPQSLAGHTYWSHKRKKKVEESTVTTRSRVFEALDETPSLLPRQLQEKLQIPYSTATTERHEWKKKHGLARKKPIKATIGLAEPVSYFPAPEEKLAETDAIKKSLTFTTQIGDSIPDDIGDRLLDSFLRRFTSMEFEVSNYRKRVIDLEKELAKAYEEVDRIRKIHNQKVLDSNKKERIQSILR